MGRKSKPNPPLNVCATRTNNKGTSSRLHCLHAYNCHLTHVSPKLCFCLSASICVCLGHATFIANQGALVKVYQMFGDGGKEINCLCITSPEMDKDDLVLFLSPDPLPGHPCDVQLLHDPDGAPFMGGKPPAATERLCVPFKEFFGPTKDTNVLTIKTGTLLKTHCEKIERACALGTHLHMFFAGFMAVSLS
jgi:hypothetical protein